jgi:hypothetical protein
MPSPFHHPPETSPTKQTISEGETSNIKQHVTADRALACGDGSPAGKYQVDVEDRYLVLEAGE